MKLKDITYDITSQLKSVIAGLDEKKYIQKIEILSNSSLGQHIRHVIECFNCFLEGYKTGIVNYDNRKRDREIEENMVIALHELIKIETQLTSLDLNKRLVMEASFDEAEQSKTLVDTTSGRELAYNIEHAIHHMALIKIGAFNICPEMKLPENFGIAYSTVHHKNKVCVQ